MLLGGSVMAREYEPEKVCDAIKLVENSQHFPYGVHKVRNGHLIGFSEPQARRMCLETLNKVKVAYKSNGEQGDYLTALSKVYCPYNSARWATMVRNRYSKL